MTPVTSMGSSNDISNAVPSNDAVPSIEDGPSSRAQRSPWSSLRGAAAAAALTPPPPQQQLLQSIEPAPPAMQAAPSWGAPLGGAPSTSASAVHAVPFTSADIVSTLGRDPMRLDEDCRSDEDREARAVEEDLEAGGAESVL